MNIDRILTTFNHHQVEYLMIGGMHFLLRHAPILTYDVDLWIYDAAANRAHCEQALIALDAEWGRTDADWGPVASLAPGWLDAQNVFCLNSPHGAIDIFRVVEGLSDWNASAQASVSGQTGGGVAYRGLSDADMLQCQLGLDPPFRKQDRMTALRQKLGLPP
jgi:hypothetical protein